MLLVSGDTTARYGPHTPTKRAEHFGRSIEGHIHTRIDRNITISAQLHEVKWSKSGSIVEKMPPKIVPRLPPMLLECSNKCECIPQISCCDYAKIYSALEYVLEQISVHSIVKIEADARFIRELGALSFPRDSGAVEAPRYSADRRQ